MNLKFLVNDYILVWNLLFQASISPDIHKLKQRLWNNYKNEYNMTFKDRNIMLKDPKNFIPNNDTIYNIFLETKEYEFVLKNTEKYRKQILAIWDNNKKFIDKELKDILKFDIPSYHVFIVDYLLDIIDIVSFDNDDYNLIVLGKKIDSSNSNKILVDLIYEIVKKEVREYRKDYKEIVQAIVELAILNEFSTRINKRSQYLTGDPSLSYLKVQIYPYWLMYLGVSKGDMKNYMERDKISFDVTKYAYEKQLKKLDLFQFIDFCIRNQKYIVKINELEII